MAISYMIVSKKQISANTWRIRAAFTTNYGNQLGASIEYEIQATDAMDFHNKMVNIANHYNDRDTEAQQRLIPQQPALPLSGSTVDVPQLQGKVIDATNRSTIIFNS